MDALVAAAGGKPGELAQKVQAEEEAEDAAEDAADAKAHRRSRAIKWLGLTGLLAHWCIFARLTYWCVVLRVAMQRARALNPQFAALRSSNAPLSPPQGAELGRDGARGVPGGPGLDHHLLSLFHGALKSASYKPPASQKRQLDTPVRLCARSRATCPRPPSRSSATKTWTAACAARSATTRRGCAPSKPRPSAPEPRRRGRARGAQRALAWAPQWRSVRLPAAPEKYRVTRKTSRRRACGRPKQ